MSEETFTVGRLGIEVDVTDDDKKEKLIDCTAILAFHHTRKQMQEFLADADVQKAMLEVLGRKEFDAATKSIKMQIEILGGLIEAGYKRVGPKFKEQVEAYIAAANFVTNTPKPEDVN